MGKHVARSSGCNLFPFDTSSVCIYGRRRRNKCHRRANAGGNVLLSGCALTSTIVSLCVCVWMHQPCWRNGTRQAIAHVIFNYVSPWKRAHMQGVGNLLLCECWGRLLPLVIVCVCVCLSVWKSINCLWFVTLFTWKVRFPNYFLCALTRCVCVCTSLARQQQQQQSEGSGKGLLRQLPRQLRKHQQADRWALKDQEQLGAADLLVG